VQLFKINANTQLYDLNKVLINVHLLELTSAPDAYKIVRFQGNGVLKLNLIIYYLIIISHYLINSYWLK
jgi:hypothetical protein